MNRMVAFVVLSLLVAGYAWHTNMRRELRVPASGWLAALRAMALVLCLALILDLRIGVGDENGLRMVLLDESPSMFAGAAESPWREAEQRSRELEREGWRVLRFGGSPDDGKGTALAPALRRAAELGAREITVVSDMRVHDRVAAEAALSTLPVEVEFEATRSALVNVGVVGLEVGDAPIPGSAVAAVAEIHGEGMDSALVELFGGVEPVSVRIAVPPAGRSSRIVLETVAPNEPGRVRYRVRVGPVPPVLPVPPAPPPDSADAPALDDFEGDNEGTADAAVGHRSGAVVLVSATPDWEPRHLLSALAEATGLPASGHLRVGEQEWMPAGSANERSTPVDWPTVLLAIESAALVVAHRFDDGELGRVIANALAPALLFPRTPAAARLVGIAAGSPVGGEWYVLSGPPASPLSSDLGELAPGLPPLTDLLIAPDATDGVSALEVARPASTESEPVLHLIVQGERRLAVATAGGFWRWAMRSDGREAYRRLWSSVAGWLLSGPAPTIAPPAEPHAVPSQELTLQPVTPGFADWGARSPDRARPAALRTASWPYLLIIALLCAEWFLRRRSGLR